MRIDSPLMTNAVITGSFSGSFTGTGNFVGLEADSVEFANVLNKPTLVSGSDQVDITATTGYTSFSSSLAGDIDSNDGRLSILEGKTLVSGSDQVDITATTGYTSFSSSIASDIAGISTDFADITNKPTLVSGSDQVDITATTGYTSFSSSIAADIAGISTDFADITNKPTLVSGSDQVDITATTGYTSFSSSLAGDIATNTAKVGYTDSLVKAKLNTENVVSGSTQILNLVSIDEDNMSSNSDTKLPTQQSVKSYVDTKVSALVDSAPGALDTLNELAAALGDDANFATTVSTTIAGKVSQSLEIISGNGLTGGGNLTTDRTLNVVGTADRISVSADAVDIAATYAGQSTITTLGTISTGTWAATDVAVAHGGTGASDAAGARTNLGLVIGTNVQAYNSTLAAVAGGTYSGDDSITTVGTVTAGNVTAILPSGTISGSSQVNHDSTTGFVANEHIDHSTVSVTAGNGLTGGGTIAATRTLNVGAGTGITVNADNIQIADNGVGATQLNVSGNGTTSQFLRSDGDGSFTWDTPAGFIVANSANNRVITSVDGTNGNAEANLTFDGSTLSVSGTVSATCVIETSALRCKSNIKPLQSSLQKVKQLKPVSFEWKNSGKSDIGFIAEEVKEVLPNLIHYNIDGEVEGMNYSKITSLLVSSIHELESKINELSNEIEKFKTN